MTTLRNFFFRMLYKKIASQLISTDQRHPSKKCPDNKVICFVCSNFLHINQLVRKYRNALDNILQGRLDNNYYEADRPHN